MKTFVIGDIHGAHMALLQCLERSGFDKKEDELIVLGDAVDGWPFVKESIDILLGLKKMRYIKGNHDIWFLDWCQYGAQEPLWINQGGEATVKSYGRCLESVPQAHVDLIRNSPYYYVDDKNRIYLHGGFHPEVPINNQYEENLAWDRRLVRSAESLAEDFVSYKISEYDEIFVGHTQRKTDAPMHFCNLWNLDTAAGWDGYLTIMDVDTREFWQSDCVLDIYQNIKGRR